MSISENAWNVNNHYRIVIKEVLSQATIRQYPWFKHGGRNRFAKEERFPSG